MFLWAGFEVNNCFVNVSDEEVIIVSCEDCGEMFDLNHAVSHKAGITHQLSLQREDGGKKNPGFLISETNAGFQMMRKNGWDGVSGLGQGGGGKLFPIKTAFKQDRKGLEVGSRKQMRITHFGANDARSVEDKRRKMKIKPSEARSRKSDHKGRKIVSASHEQLLREDLGDI